MTEQPGVQLQRIQAEVYSRSAAGQELQQQPHERGRVVRSLRIKRCDDNTATPPFTVRKTIYYVNHGRVYWPVHLSLSLSLGSHQPIHTYVGDVSN